MSRVVAINGSPRMEKGDTHMILVPFLKGMEDAGAEVETLFASRLEIKACDCNEMRCWYKHAGTCRHKDDMPEVLAKLKRADVLVLATPVYVPLPGDMQNLINRLCPLLTPVLETREGRTRSRFRDDVGIQRMVLVSTGGWWEKENMGTVVRIVEELAKNGGVEFAGAVLRPHVQLMKQQGAITAAAAEVVGALEQAGGELIRQGAMNPETLDAISRPLISQEELLRSMNSLLGAAG